MKWKAEKTRLGNLKANTGSFWVKILKIADKTSLVLDTIKDKLDESSIIQIFKKKCEFQVMNKNGGIAWSIILHIPK